MSYDIEECTFSDNGRECGITGYFSDDAGEAIARTDFAVSDSVEPLNTTQVEIDRVLSREATKAVAHLKTIEQIQNKLLKKLMALNLDCMISSYSRSERLPEGHVRVSQQPRALPILIKGFLKSHLSPDLDVKTLDGIEILCEKIYQNDEYEIAYERVSQVQRFIHDVFNEIHGVDQHLKLPVKPMRHLLSAARLHLNIVDFKYQSPEAMLSILMRSKQASDEERASKGGTISIPRGRRYIKNWRVLHLDSIMQFQSSEIGNRLYRLLQIEKDQDIQIFREQAIGVYCGYIRSGELPIWIQTPRWSN